MNIREATRTALDNDTEMYRESVMTSDSNTYATIKPTNSYDSCLLIVNRGDKKESCRNWNPTADDLMADDWEVLNV